MTPLDSSRFTLTRPGLGDGPAYHEHVEVVLASEHERLREAAQAVVDRERSIDRPLDLELRLLVAKLETALAPADHNEEHHG